MSDVETAIENMIQSHIDEQDFVCRLDAEQYADSEVNDARADFEAELTELQQRIEALESRETPDAVQEHSYELEHRIETLEEKQTTAQPIQVEEPRAVNQIDWIMTPSDMIAGYDSKAMLESYVRSCLHHDQTSVARVNQAEIVIAMVLATARNLINEKLESQS